MKIKAYLNQNKFVLLGWIIPLVILIFIYMTVGITPFGPSSVLISDMDGGYVDACTALRHVFLNGQSLVYNWAQIQGSTTLSALGIGHLFSLFNFLLIIVPESNILMAITWMIILKITLAGGTFAFYLKKTYDRNDLSISIFGWCYALMGYTIVYFFHIIWLDQILMLPLVMWGVERILKDRKKYLGFTLSLVAIFLMNFYMAYMLGVFAFLYFIYRYITLNKTYEMKDFIGKFGSFMLSPILALGCSAGLLVPIFMMMGGRDNLFNGDNFSNCLRYEFPQLFGKFFIGTLDTILPGGVPFIYCGIIVLVLILAYFISYAVSYKEKICSFIFITFMLISLTYNPLYVVWHGFKPPVYFEGRFSFLVCFLMIMIAYKGFNRLQTLSDRQIHIIFIILGLAFTCFNRQMYAYVSDKSLLCTLGFLFAYYVLIMFVRKKSAYKIYGKPLLAVIVAFELLTNGQMTMENYGEFPLAEEYNLAYTTLKQKTASIMAQDQDFYRIERTGQRSLNDGFGVGYPSIAHFDAMYNYDMKEQIGKLGYEVGHNWIRYAGATPLTDMLINIKYVLNGNKQFMGYDLEQEDEIINIFKNPYTVSLGFMIPEDINDLTEENNPIVYQNNVLNRMVGENKLYFDEIKSVEVDDSQIGHFEKTIEETSEEESDDLFISEQDKEKKKEIKVDSYYKKDLRSQEALVYRLTAEEDGSYYAYFDHSYTGKVELFINDKDCGEYFEYTNPSIYLGDYKKGDLVEIKLEPVDDGIFTLKNVSFYRLDAEKLEKASEQLNRYALQVTKHSDTVIEGNITTDSEHPYLYLAMPYDEGWQLIVDGNKIDTQKVENTFLGAKLEPGEHEIKLIYKTKGLEVGMIISVITCLGVILLAFRKNKQN